MKSQKGITYVELMIAFTLGIILLLVTLVVLKPAEIKRRGRDEKRLTDIVTLERSVAEYRMDNGVYPDTIDVLRLSTQVPVGNSGPVENPRGGGWVDADFSKYTSKLPIDPLNDAAYFYSYMQNGTGYEINARLEFHSEYSLNSYDGGDDDTVYEVGNNLTIL